MMKRLKNKKGFTLIELIVVISILGILTLIAIPRLTGFQEKAKLSADKATYDMMNRAIAIAVANEDITVAVADLTATISTTGGVTWTPTSAATTMNNLFTTKPVFKRSVNLSKAARWDISAGGVVTVDTAGTTISLTE